MNIDLKEYINGREDLFTANDVVEMEDALTKFLEWYLKAINYTQCCEKLPSFLYKHEQGLYFKHLEDTDITDQWNEYLKNK